MKNLPKKYCKYCEPYPANSIHISERLANMLPLYALQSFFISINFFFRNRFPKLHYFFIKIFIEKFFDLMIFSNILQEIEINDDDENLHNRSLVVIQAARLRGIKIKSLKMFGKFKTNFFTIIAKNKKSIFEGLPLLEIGRASSIDFDDKLILKQILKNYSLPFAEGYSFWNKKTAIKYARELGFPLVIKPRSGSLSKHTTCNIKNNNELQKAINITQIISRDFILEKFIAGDMYRITVINNKIIACCLREAPNVIGDGIHTIEELINIKNDNPLRGDKNKKNFTLHKIIISEQTIIMLMNQNLTIKSILSLGNKIYLHNKIILACGADIHDKTDDVHPDNNMLFVKLASLLQAPIIGIDFICQNISKTYRKQTCAIIEVNSLPYIDMHHFPVSGKSRDVAGYIVDHFLSLKQ